MLAPTGHHRLHDGLRHDRHRARPGAGQVQEAGRRRHVQDRQQQRAAGAEQAGLRPRDDPAASSTTSTRRTPSRAARNCSDEHLPVFDCAFKPANGERSIDYMGHIKMMAAVQPFLSGAISKTVNMPTDSDRRGDRAGLHRGLAPGAEGDRDLPRRLQADPAAEHRRAATRPQEQKTVSVMSVAPQLRRRKLPDTRTSVTHKFSVAGHEGYITVGLLRGRQAGRDLHHAGQGRLDPGRLRRRLRHRDLVLPAARRGAALPGGQVRPRPLRALRLHRQPGASRSPSRSSTTSSAGWRWSSCPRKSSLEQVAQPDNGTELEPDGAEAGPAGLEGARAGRLRGPGRRAALSRVRIADDPQRRLLRLRQLRGDQRLLLDQPPGRTFLVAYGARSLSWIIGRLQAPQGGTPWV